MLPCCTQTLKFTPSQVERCTSMTIYVLTYMCTHRLTQRWHQEVPVDTRDQAAFRQLVQFEPWVLQMIQNQKSNLPPPEGFKHAPLQTVPYL